MERKTYSSGYELARAWALHQTSEGRNGSNNFSFYEGRLFSYTTVIGQIDEAPNGDTIYLIDTSYFSKTTSKHQQLMTSVIPTNALVAECCFPAWRLEMSDFGFNIICRLREVNNLFALQKNARKRDYRDPIKDILFSVRKFVGFYNLDKAIKRDDLNGARCSIFGYMEKHKECFKKAVSYDSEESNREQIREIKHLLKICRERGLFRNYDKRLRTKKECIPTEFDTIVRNIMLDYLGSDIADRVYSSVFATKCMHDSSFATAKCAAL